MRLRLSLLIVGLIGCGMLARGEELATMTPERLLFHATRYGDTAERRAFKAEARKEVRNRMPAIFAEIMDRMPLENVGLQVLAMELAESYRLTEMTALLRGYLDSEDPTTRKLAVYFLSFQDREEDLVPVLIGLLDNETSRGGAMRTLAAWRVVEAAEPVELFLEDGRERIRIAAANALRDLGQARSAPALIRALGDPVFTVRHAAARALVVLGEDALPVIDAALDPADPRTRQILMQILEDIHTPAALERRQSFDPVFPSEPIQVEQGYYRRPQ